MKITGEAYGTVVTVTITDEADIDTVFRTFRTIAVGLGFHPDNFTDAAVTFVDENTVGGIDKARVS